MLDIGWTEILVIAIIMIVVVGPKDLPGMLRTFGRTTSKMRSMAGEFRKQFDDAVKEAELDEVRNLASQARSLNPASQIRKAMSPMEMAAKDVKAGLDGAMKSKPAAPAASDTAAAPDAAVAAEPLKTGATAMPAAADATPAPATAAPAKPAASAAAAKPVSAKASTPKPAGAAKPATANPAKPAAKPKAASKPRAAAKPKAPKGGTDA
jgi:sec-independent protein translocase protein TatB